MLSENYKCIYFILNDDINNLKTSFQDGVTLIYNSLVGKGITPNSNSPEDISTSINNIVIGKDSMYLTISVDGSKTSPDKDDVTATAKISGTISIELDLVNEVIASITHSLSLKATAKNVNDNTSRSGTGTPTVTGIINDLSDIGGDADV